MRFLNREGQKFNCAVTRGFEKRIFGQNLYIIFSKTFMELNILITNQLYNEKNFGMCELNGTSIQGESMTCTGK